MWRCSPHFVISKERGSSLRPKINSLKNPAALKMGNSQVLSNDAFSKHVIHIKHSPNDMIEDSEDDDAVEIAPHSPTANVDKNSTFIRQLSDSDSSAAEPDAEGSTDEIQDWLSKIGMSKYLHLFVKNGYRALDEISKIETADTLSQMGIIDESEQRTILQAIKKALWNDHHLNEHSELESSEVFDSQAVTMIGIANEESHSTELNAKPKPVTLIGDIDTGQESVDMQKSGELNRTDDDEIFSHFQGDTILGDAEMDHVNKTVHELPIQGLVSHLKRTIPHGQNDNGSLLDSTETLIGCVDETEQVRHGQ